MEDLVASALFAEDEGVGGRALHAAARLAVLLEADASRRGGGPAEAVEASHRRRAVDRLLAAAARAAERDGVLPALPDAPPAAASTPAPPNAEEVARSIRSLRADDPAAFAPPDDEEEDCKMPLPPPPPPQQQQQQQRHQAQQKPPSFSSVRREPRQQRQPPLPPQQQQQQQQQQQRKRPRPFEPPPQARAQQENEAEESDPREAAASAFMTGSAKLAIDEKKRGGGGGAQKRQRQHSGGAGGAAKRPGLSRRQGSTVRQPYNPPFRQDDDGRGGSGGGGDNGVGPQAENGLSSAPSFVRKALGGKQRPNGNSGGGGGGGSKKSNGKSEEEESELPEELQGLDPKLVEMISSEILDSGAGVRWDDIAGLEFAKRCVMEIVVWPLQMPEVFTGLRAPPKGMLLFGPPGTGKTLIAKAIATEAKSTFFSISASSLGSKWHGEGEKLVRTLFALAAYHQPSIVFIDEIDSLLCQRSDTESEGDRRMKTEFLIRLEGANTPAGERVLVIGATNRPQELDEAARRRLVKRLYIPLPNEAARRALVAHLLRNERHTLGDAELDAVAARTRGYSGADMKSLCTEAAFGPVRSVGDLRRQMAEAAAAAAAANGGVGGGGPAAPAGPPEIRPITMDDFEDALRHVRPSVGRQDLRLYLDWNEQFGSFPADEEAKAQALDEPPPPKADGKAS